MFESGNVFTASLVQAANWHHNCVCTIQKMYRKKMAKGPS